MENLSTVKKIIDRNIISTCSTYFLCSLPSLSIHVKGAQGSNVGNPWLRSAYTGVSCIKSSSTKGVGTMDTCSNGAYIRDICIGSTYNMGNCIEDTNIGGICGLVYKSSKYSVWCLRLLVKSTSNMPVSFYLYLQVIPEKEP